eukprot:scpid74785/ scgid5746/ 
MKKRTVQSSWEEQVEEDNVHLPYSLRGRPVGLRQFSESHTETDCHQPGPVSDSNDQGDVVRSTVVSDLEDENTADMHHELVCQSSGNLHSLLYDVWISSLLPLLDVRSMFRLCGVSRNLRELLMTEQTFKLLCVRRYGISPLLDLSYIDISKTLFAVTTTMRLDISTCSRIYHLLPPRKYNHMPRPKKVLDLALPLLSAKMESLKKQGEDYARIICNHDSLDCSILNIVVKGLPKLEKIDIEQEYPPPRSDVTGNARICYDWCHLSNLKNLSVQRCGSVEAYQTEVIEKMMSFTWRVLPMLRYHYREQRLVEVANVLSATVGKFPEALGCLGVAFPGSNDPVDVRMACKVSQWHSALQLYIVNQLDMSLEDYFKVCLEYRKVSDAQVFTTEKGWRYFYSGLGEHLRTVLSPDHSENRASQKDLLDYFAEYAELVDWDLVINITDHLCCYDAHLPLETFNALFL